MKKLKFNDSAVMELVAILLAAPVNGSRRITKGDLIAINGDVIVDADPPTHKIEGCFGTINSGYLAIMVSDVITNDVKLLKIQ